MTEAAIKRAKKQKLNRIIFIIVTILIATLLVLWGIQFNITNSKAIPQLVEYYEMGEYVDIGGNFFFDETEYTDGYSIRVNSAELVNYEEYMIANDIPINYSLFSAEYPMPKYAILMDISMKNVENIKGSVLVLKFALTNGSLSIPISFEIWDGIDEHFDGSPALRLRENTEVDILLPFVPSLSDTSTNSKELERRMETEDFYFCICEFPVRKMIRVPIENCVN